MLFARIALLVAVCFCHHLPCHGDITPSSPPTKIQDEADSPPHPSDADVNGADDNDADDNNADNNADNNTDVDTDNNADINADNGQRRRQWRYTQMTDSNVDDVTATQTTGYDADDWQRCRQQQRSCRRQRRNADNEVVQ